MNKQEFLNTLEEALGNFTAEEKKEILYDYEEHFAIGEESGKSDEQIIAELGEPESIAKQYKGTQRVERAEKEPEGRSLIGVLLVGFGLVFFNLIFLFGPFCGIAGAVIGFFGASFGLTLGGIGVVIGMILAPVLPQYIHVAGVPYVIAGLFLGVGMTALGILFFIGSCYMAKFIYRITVRYIKWNIKCIIGKGV